MSIQPTNYDLGVAATIKVSVSDPGSVASVDLEEENTDITWSDPDPSTFVADAGAGTLEFTATPMGTDAGDGQLTITLMDDDDNVLGDTMFRTAYINPMT